jgi:hypothetical protein
LPKPYLQFQTSDFAPVHGDGVGASYYWAEIGTVFVNIHYVMDGTTTVFTHPLEFGSNLTAAPWDLSVSEFILAAVTNDSGSGEIQAWGPLNTDPMRPDSVHEDAVLTTVTTDVSAAYIMDETSMQPGVYRWDGKGTYSAYILYADLGIAAGSVRILRVTPTYLLVATQYDVLAVNRTSKAVQSIFHSDSAPIVDLRASRPHTINAGALIRVQDPSYPATGRDYYIDLAPATLPAATDVAAAIDAQPAPAGCPQLGYVDGGVLYGNRYIYGSSAGLASVTLAPDGTPGTPALVTDVVLSYPEVSANGNLYASAQSTSKWTYYFVGGL